MMMMIIMIIMIIIIFLLLFQLRNSRLRLSCTDTLQNVLRDCEKDFPESFIRNSGYPGSLGVQHFQ